MNKKVNGKEQLDLRDAAALIGKSWQTLRYYQTHPLHPVPHYKRKGDAISGRDKNGKYWCSKVDPKLKGTRVIFLREEVLEWYNKNLKE